MVRAVLVAVTGALALTAAPLIAKPVTARPTHGKLVRAKKVLAKGDKAKRVAAKSRAKSRTKAPRPRVKTTAKPLVAVAQAQSDGRVKYGRDHLPPGFAWPPTDEMLAVGKACEQELDVLGIPWKPAPAEAMVADPIVVPSMELGGIAYTSAFRHRGAPTMDCHFAIALAKLGPELYGLGVREVQYGSVVRMTLARSHGQTKDFWSRHALGIAMDIRSFVDQSGRVATVETDYLKDDPLLHGIEDLINGRTQFRQVLTPGNDPISHDDHFHIEASVDFTAFR